MFKAHTQKILWSSEPTYGDVSRYGHKTQPPRRLEGAGQGGLDRSWFDCSEAPVCRQPESEFGSGPGKKKKTGDFFTGLVVALVNVCSVDGEVISDSATHTFE